MHGVSRDDEIVYWRERAEAAEAALADATRTVEAMRESVTDAARLLSRCLPYIATAIGEWRADGDHEMASAIILFKQQVVEFIDEHGGDK